MTRKPQPLFLARETFRRRRLMDAARLLAVCGLFLILMPMFWPAPEGDAPATAREGVYLFAVWLALVIAAALLAGRLSAVMKSDDDTGGSKGP